MPLSKSDQDGQWVGWRFVFIGCLLVYCLNSMQTGSKTFLHKSTMWWMLNVDRCIMKTLRESVLCHLLKSYVLYLLNVIAWPVNMWLIELYDFKFCSKILSGMIFCFCFFEVILYEFFQVPSDISSKEEHCDHEVSSFYSLYFLLSYALYTMACVARVHLKYRIGFSIIIDWVEYCGW